MGRKRKTFRETGTRPAGFAPYQSDLHIHDLSLKSDEAFEGTERDIRLHIGQDTQVFTVSIPAGVENGTLLNFKRPVGENQEIELLFRVTIAE